MTFEQELARLDKRCVSSTELIARRLVDRYHPSMEQIISAIMERGHRGFPGITRAMLSWAGAITFGEQRGWLIKGTKAWWFDRWFRNRNGGSCFYDGPEDRYRDKSLRPVAAVVHVRAREDFSALITHMAERDREEGYAKPSFRCELLPQPSWHDPYRSTAVLFTPLHRV